MKEFFEEFAYMCSASNTKSRGFYIMLAIGMVLLTLGGLAGIVLNIVTLVKGIWQLYYLLLTVIAIGIDVALVIWLVKSK